ncbi:unnamed protein product [Strongylus vulgaris]|uniref:Uncharacterized protein n=1 Tax=Strongylus vulgaris TaxID=40348 RepID=A0A3P7IYT8_STRVU|nr:unnamed protein product [Strongylus vulgaris]
MHSTPPPPYPGGEAPADDVTLKDDTIVPEKKKEPSPSAAKPAAASASSHPPTNPPIENRTGSTEHTVTLLYRADYTATYPGSSAANAIFGTARIGAPGMPCVGSPPTIQPTMAYAAAPAAMPGYTAPMQMPQMFPQQPTMPMNSMGMPGGIGTAPTQAGGINLVVNTNANANSDSNAKNGSSPPPKPAPRPCPKCRLGYITRGQARFREIYHIS